MHAPLTVSGHLDRSKAPRGRSRDGRYRVLLVAGLFNMPYRIMRSLTGGGAEVYVIGTSGARPLRSSRHCRGFHHSHRVICGGQDDELVLEINCLVRDLEIDMVIAGDAPSTRFLIANRDSIEGRCFPMPDLATFDELNDKWAFGKLCRTLGIPHPATRLLPTAAALEQDVAKDNVSIPFVAKPLSRSGNSGVIFIKDRAQVGELKGINYRPVLVQDFIPGTDLCASVYARAGRIEAFMGYRISRQVFHTYSDERVLIEIAKIIEHCAFDGVCNFDMRLTPGGDIYFVECNPRLFYNVDLAMVSGLNFLTWGMHPAPPGDDPYVAPDAKVRLPKGLAYSLLTSLRCSRRDWAVAGNLLRDPLPNAMERLKLTY